MQRAGLDHGKIRTGYAHAGFIFYAPYKIIEGRIGFHQYRSAVQIVIIHQHIDGIAIFNAILLRFLKEHQRIVLLLFRCRTEVMNMFNNVVFYRFQIGGKLIIVLVFFFERFNQMPCRIQADFRVQLFDLFTDAFLQMLHFPDHFGRPFMHHQHFFFNGFALFFFELLVFLRRQRFTFNGRYTDKTGCAPLRQNTIGFGHFIEPFDNFRPLDLIAFNQRSFGPFVFFAAESFRDIGF